MSSISPTHPGARTGSRPASSGARRVLLVLAVWSTAFGYIEGAVVVYLRGLFYPAGFRFPLVGIQPRYYGVEALREAATMVLLAGVAYLAGRRGLRRFSAFAFCFGAWDIVFYLTLKAALNWPASLLDWDILFLIPVPWTGPVLAPVLVSVALIASGAYLLLRPEESLAPLRPADWVIEAAAGFAIIGAFVWNLPAISRGEAPSKFPWLLFSLGLIIGTGWFLRRIGPPRGARR
jgi:hypothetical protein